MAQLEVCHVQRSQNPISSRRWSQNGPESSEACPAELESKNKAKCVQWKWKWKWKCVQPEKFVSSSAEMPSNWARIRYRAAAAETPNRQYYPNLSQLMPTACRSKIKHHNSDNTISLSLMWKHLLFGEKCFSSCFLLLCSVFWSRENTGSYFPIDFYWTVDYVHFFLRCRA